MTDRRILSHALMACERLIKNDPKDGTLNEAYTHLKAKWKDWFGEDWHAATD